MKIFKNKIGRPSNETIRQRRLVVTAIVFVIAAVTFQGITFLYNNSNKYINSVNKNVAIPAGKAKSGDVATAVNYNKRDYKITDDDVAIIAKISSNLTVSGLTRQSYADIDGNGKVNNSDVKLAIRIASKYKGYQYGDIDKNGKVDMSDSREISRYLSGYKLTTDQKRLADVDGNGKVDSTDARLISRLSSGYGDLCSQKDNTRGDGLITQEDIDLMLEFAGGYKTPTYSQRIAADINGNGKITESDVRSAANKITQKDNLFNTTSTTKNGVKITYDKKTGYLTLNGTATSSIDLMRLMGQKFITNDEYTVTLKYMSGSITNSGSYFTTEIKQNNNNANIKTRNYVNVAFPTAGSKTGTLKINTSASATGRQLYVWINKSKNKLVFKNYRIKVDITKKFSSKLVDKTLATKDQLRKIKQTSKKQVSKMSNISYIDKISNTDIYNFFESENYTKSVSGLTIKYNSNSNVITINGTTNSSVMLAQIGDLQFVEGDMISINAFNLGGYVYVDANAASYLEYDVYSTVKVSAAIVGNVNNNCDGESILPRNSNNNVSFSLNVNSTAAKTANTIYLFLENENDLSITFDNYTIDVRGYSIKKGYEPYTPSVLHDNVETKTTQNNSSNNTSANGFKKLNYNINSISEKIGSQDQNKCHIYAIAYGSYILLGKTPLMVNPNNKPTISVNASSEFGGCYYTTVNDRNCSTVTEINSIVDEFNVIVSKINSGIPVSIHVKGDYTSQHWVLVTGYRSGYKSNYYVYDSNDLLENVWIIDPYSNAGYNDKSTLWEGVASSRNSAREILDYEIRTWDEISKAK